MVITSSMHPCQRMWLHVICEPVCFRRSQCYAIGTYLAGPYGGGVRWVRTNPPPPSGTCGKQKSEPNHFVAVQELIEGSELEVSLKRLKFPSVYALYHRTVLHLVMTSLGDCDSSHRFRGQWELFRNVTPLFKTLRTGLLSLQYISFAKGFCESE